MSLFSSSVANRSISGARAISGRSLFATSRTALDLQEPFHALFLGNLGVKEEGEDWCLKAVGVNAPRDNSLWKHESVSFEESSGEVSGEPLLIHRGLANRTSGSHWADTAT